MLFNIMQKLRKRKGAKVIVLMYHRIAQVNTDPWQLAVTPENFEQQLIVLKENFTVISVHELMNQLATKDIKSDAVCLTFDDAYSDNFVYAKPLLKKSACPATFFIPTYYINQKKQFWWDELEDIVLNSIELPETLSLPVNENTYTFKFEADDNILNCQKQEMQKKWTGQDSPPTERCKLYIELWQLLKPLPFDRIIRIMDEIKNWSRYAESNDELKFPMNLQQLQEINAQTLFEIGIHTETHPALAYHSSEVQQDEIVKSKEYLQKNCKKALDILAYPYGNYNNSTISVLKKQKIKAAFTTESKAVTGDSDIFQLGRFAVQNWNREEFEKKIYMWLKGI